LIPVSDYPSFTVLITTYNYGRFVGRAIESVLGQQYPRERIEILVVDDGSTDDTPQVVQNRYGDRVRYIRKARGGQASAFNCGFRAATGDVICLLDADDYFYPAKLALVARALRDSPQAGVVYDDFDIVDNSGARLGKAFPEPTWTGLRIPPATIPDQLRDLILLGHPWSAIASMRRSVAERLGLPDNAAPSDVFVGLVLPYLAEVAVVAEAGTAYVFHGGNEALFRSSEHNRRAHAKQMALTRRYIEERFGVRFVSYLGRSIYDPDMAPRPPFLRRWRPYLEDRKQITTANVEARVKRRSQMKLVAALLLPDPLYRRVRRLRARR
jgi:glycosyltransferase involved in cell wall biosynthesis